MFSLGLMITVPDVFHNLIYQMEELFFCGTESISYFGTKIWNIVPTLEHIMEEGVRINVGKRGV